LYAELAKQGITVVLTARDTNRGERAVESLKCEGLHDNVNFHSLDVRSEQSALALAEWLRDTYGGIDILVKYILNLAPKCTFPVAPTIQHIMN
jgi:NAD(P)-dependent dehydrogenase (short-subunit alcohol dehydrogenase family)